MVASYDIGEPVRSFVLVPGTGKEKGTRPLCLDLARTSTVAGSITVPSTIPSTTPVTNTKAEKEDGKSGGKLASKSDQKVASENQARATESVTLNRDVSRTSSSTTPDASNTQQARSLTHQVARDVSGTKRRLEVDGEDGKESNVPSKIIKTDAQGVKLGVKLRSGSSMSIRPPDQEVNELRKKCAELEKQNSNLNRRLAMFHDLFRSKERLVSFVKTLETFSEGKASKSNGA